MANLMSHRDLRAHRSRAHPAGLASANITGIGKIGRHQPIVDVTWQVAINARMWCSTPFPPFFAKPIQENPNCQWTVNAATITVQAIPNAAIRVRNPTITPIEPRNSAAIAKRQRVLGCPFPGGTVSASP